MTLVEKLHEVMVYGKPLMRWADIRSGLREMFAEHVDDSAMIKALWREPSMFEWDNEAGGFRLNQMGRADWLVASFGLAASDEDRK